MGWGGVGAERQWRISGLSQQRLQMPLYGDREYPPVSRRRRAIAPPRGHLWCLTPMPRPATMQPAALLLLVLAAAVTGCRAAASATINLSSNSQVFLIIGGEGGQWRWRDGAINGSHPRSHSSCGCSQPAPDSIHVCHLADWGRIGGDVSAGGAGCLEVVAGLASYPTLTAADASRR